MPPPGGLRAYWPVGVQRSPTQGEGISRDDIGIIGGVLRAECAGPDFGPEDEVDPTEQGNL